MSWFINWTDVCPIFVGRERKGQAVLLPLVLLRGTEEVGKTGTERLTSGPAKRVRMGRIGVEGFFDFRRGLGGLRIWPLLSPIVLLKLSYAVLPTHQLGKNAIFIFIESKNDKINYVFHALLSCFNNQ